MKKLLFALLIPSFVLAAPVVIPPLKLCEDVTTGAILAKKRCNASEVTLTSAALKGPQGDVGPQGAQGVQGSQGANGVSRLDLTQCARRQATTIGSGDLLLSATCLTDEYLLTHGQSNTGATTVSESSLLYSATGVPVGAQYYLYALNSNSYSFTVQVYCCRFK